MAHDARTLGDFAVEEFDCKTYARTLQDLQEFSLQLKLTARLHH